MQDDMRNLMFLLAALHQLPVQPGSLVLANVNLLERVAPHDEFVKRVELFLGQPFGALDHGGADEGALVV